MREPFRYPRFFHRAARPGRPASLEISRGARRTKDRPVPWERPIQTRIGTVRRKRADRCHGDDHARYAAKSGRPSGFLLVGNARCSRGVDVANQETKICPATFDADLRGFPPDLHEIRTRSAAGLGFTDVNTSVKQSTPFGVQVSGDPHGPGSGTRRHAGFPATNRARRPLSDRAQPAMRSSSR